MNHNWIYENRFVEDEWKCSNCNLIKCDYSHSRIFFGIVNSDDEWNYISSEDEINFDTISCEETLMRLVLE